MAYPAEYTDSDSDTDSWSLDEFLSDTESFPVEEYYVWKRPNTYQLVPKFQELIRDYPEGILLKDFPDAYYKKYFEHLEWSNYGYKTLVDLIMDYSDVLQFIREGTDPNGWLTIDANRPPSEAERTTLSMRLNRGLIQEIKQNIARAVKFYFTKEESNFQIGLPIEKLQSIYEELFGCLVRFEVLGFNSLASFCLAVDGNGFNVCRVDNRYLLIPPLEPWHWPEPEEEPRQPILLELEQDHGEFPKDVAGPDATFYELDYKRFIKPGDIMQINIAKYDDPSNFYFRLRAFEAMFLEFKKGLLDFYRFNREYTMPVQSMRPGQVCVVSYFIAVNLPPTWDRGQIVRVINGEMVTVLFVDSGKTVNVPVNRVKFLHKQFVYFPVQIIPGKLAGVAPKGVKFDEGTMAKFEQFTKELYLEAEVHSPDFNRPMFPLILFSRCSRKSVNRVFLDSGRNKMKPRIPYCILTRKVREVRTNNRINPGRQCVLTGRWSPESELLVTDSDSDENFSFLHDRVELEELLNEPQMMDGSDESTPSGDIPPTVQAVSPRGPLSPVSPRGQLSPVSSFESLAPVHPSGSLPSLPLFESLPLASPSGSVPPVSSPRPSPAVAETSTRPITDQPRTSSSLPTSSSSSDENSIQYIRFPTRFRLDNNSVIVRSICIPQLSATRRLKIEEQDDESQEIKQSPEGGVALAEDRPRTQPGTSTTPKMSELRDGTTPSPAHAPEIENDSSSPDTNSMDEAEETSSNCVPSTSKGVTASKSAASSSRAIEAHTSNSNQNSKKEKAQIMNKSQSKGKNTGTYCSAAPNILGEDETESETETEESLDYTDYIRASDDEESDVASAQGSNPRGGEHSQGGRGVEVNRLIMRFMSHNQIIQEVGLNDPLRALRIATAWAKYVMLMNYGSPSYVDVFNPVEMCFNGGSRHIPYELRTLAEMLPEQILNKYVKSACKSVEESGESSSSGGNPAHPLSAPTRFRARQLRVQQQRDRNNGGIGGNLSAMFQGGDDSGFERRLAVIVIERLDIPKKRQYKVTIDRHTYYCTKGEINVLLTFPKTGVLRDLNSIGRALLRWVITTKEEEADFGDFERCFLRYVISHNRMKLLERGFVRDV